MTSHDCTNTSCTPHIGPIHTLPKYFENGLASNGDPAVAFGPKPDENGNFSWDNGSRLYYANLAGAINAAFPQIEPFNGLLRSPSRGLMTSPAAVSKTRPTGWIR